MVRIIEAAHQGMPVLGICNGFQLLTESRLLPGAFVANKASRFVCLEQSLIVENNSTPFTMNFSKNQNVIIPIKNSDGCYFAQTEDLDRIENEGRVVLRYAGSNPSGSSRNIAGICNEQGNIVGMMPHPEYAVEPGFGPPGLHGAPVFSAISSWINNAR